MRWLPWLIGAAALLLIWNLMSGRSGTTEAPEPTAAVTTSAPNAGAPASAAVEVSLPAKVYFDVGSRGSTLHPDFRPFSESASSAGAGLTAAIAKALWWHVCNSNPQA